VTAIGAFEDIYSRFEEKVCKAGRRACLGFVGCELAPGPFAIPAPSSASLPPPPSLQAGKLARLLPLYLFTPWIEDALKAANPDTLTVRLPCCPGVVLLCEEDGLFVRVALFPPPS
jgi:hypothetical protein